jgi:4-amino-4-deoxy-L-arabinose transferase-like glycosyltransferase
MLPAKGHSWWIRAATEPAIAVFLIGIFYATLLGSLRDKSPTVDEPGHATAGYAYWQAQDFRLDPENGNLAQRWLALPFLFEDTVFPSRDSPAWRDADLWAIADQWFYRLGNDVEAMLRKGRANAAIVAVVLGILVWAWSRHLFGAYGGLLSLLLYVLNPAILANGGLMTSDCAVTFGLLAATAAVWAVLQKMTVLRLLTSSVVTGGLLMTKMSAVIIIPVCAILVVVRIIDARPWSVLGGRSLRLRRQIVLASFGAVILHASVAWVMIWACYAFRFSASPDDRAANRFYFPWEWVTAKPPPNALLAELELSPTQKQGASEIFRARSADDNIWTNNALDALAVVQKQVLDSAQSSHLASLMSDQPRSIRGRFLGWLREHKIFPEAYTYGSAHILTFSGKRGSFLNGQFRLEGSPWFFPFAFAVKTPLPFFGICGLGIAGMVVLLRREGGSNEPRWRRIFADSYDICPLIVLFAVYWTAILMSGTNIGHRHLLPIYPPLFILCGFVARSAAILRSKAFGAAIGFLVLLHSVDTWVRFPNFIAYFNGTVSPQNAYHHLVDSSLDWGQDLPAIAKYSAEFSGRDRIYFAYFGVASPRHYKVKAREIYSFPGVEWFATPLLKTMPGVAKDDASVKAYLSANPDYDTHLVMEGHFEGKQATVLVKLPETLKLAGGIYLISASLAQPVSFRKASGPWSQGHEARYMQLHQAIAPLLSDDTAVRVSALVQRSAAEWQAIYHDYMEFRFARLAAFLRRTEPADTLNYSILVYRLTDSDLETALYGPPPVEAPAVP